MKIYVACPWVDRDFAEEWANEFERDGHTITRRWWEHEAEDGGHTLLSEQAVADINAVSEADVVVVLQSSKSEGKAVETGAAIVLGIPVVVVLWDEPGNIFHRHPGVIMVDDGAVLRGALAAIEAFAL